MIEAAATELPEPAVEAAEPETAPSVPAVDPSPTVPVSGSGEPEHEARPETAAFEPDPPPPETPPEARPFSGTVSEAPDAPSDHQEAGDGRAFVPVEPTGAAAHEPRGWSNFATAIAIAVVLMAGSIIYLFYQIASLGPDTSGEIAALTSRVAALESRPAPDTSALARQAAAAQDAAGRTQADLSALTKRVDGLAAPQPGANLPGQVADLQHQVADLKTSLEALQKTVASIPRPDVNRIEARFGDLDGRLGSLQGAVSGIPHVDLGPLTGKVDAIEGRLKPLEAEVEAAQSPQRVAERKAAPVAVTAQAIVEAIGAGQAFPQEFRALQVLGTDPAKLAPLQVVAANGAPSLHDLQDDLAQARERMVADGTPTPSGSYMDRLMAGATNLVQVRPLGSIVGDQPSAIVARMNQEIGADDLAAALADWQKLPEASRDASRSLSERMKLRLDAERAARDIATNAIGALAPPRG